MLEMTLRSIIAFQNALASDPRFLRLQEAEKAMENDPDAISCSAQKDRKNEIYEEKCRFFGEDSDEAKKAYSALYEAKCKLDEIPSVKAYQEAFNALHMVYFEIDRMVFGPFRNQKGCHR